MTDPSEILIMLRLPDGPKWMSDHNVGRSRPGMTSTGRRG